jgi:hypothetical protein
VVCPYIYKGVKAKVKLSIILAPLCISGTYPDTLLDESLCCVIEQIAPFINFLINRI